MRTGAGLLPAWDIEAGRTDQYYWYFGTLALFQVGDPEWRGWNSALARTLVKNQHPKGSGARAGSFDPVGPWQFEGGRIYSTALLTMCLQARYRFERANR